MIHYLEPTIVTPPDFDGSDFLAGSASGRNVVLLHVCVCACVCVSDCGFLSICSVDECRNIILQYGVREVTASQVARVLGMMARTHSGLSDGIPIQV